MYDDTEGGLLQIEEKPLKKYLSNVVQVQDPNTTEYEKVLTNTNTPDGLYYYIQTMIWADGIKGQVAYGYNINKIYYRYKYPASAGWSNWTLIGGKEWKEVSWSGVATGGIITTGMSMLGKFVDLQFVSSANSAHKTHTNLYWATGNNYMLATIGNETVYITCNSTTSTGFNLTISPARIKLESIRYLD